jgi:stage V sporulation protein R
LADDSGDSHYEVTSIHDERGYERVRSALARSFDVGANQPDIQVIDVDLLGDRHLRLQHTVHNDVVLAEGTRDVTLRHIRHLWGYEVSLAEVDAQSSETLHEWSTNGA